MNVLDIGEVAERSGIPPSTLRYYEEIGLIRSVRRHGLRRQFDADILLKLSLIRLGQSAGFTLGEVAGVFGQDGQLALPRAELHARADALQRQMAELRLLRDVLRHIADCPAPTHLECPNFRKLLHPASRPGAKKRTPRPRAEKQAAVPRR
ncbi:MerR family transcriptional regulator [Aureimonas sp. SA4125]|nr:helix-turn-helix domain-containing protein [Aureimonas sp. SA4125]BDA85539.1 MerR family transcriptional regulator [Aureimonas sp. SA4125]